MKEIIDRSVFFHQAAIKICGSLEIEKAMFESFDYLGDFIPMNGIDLVWFDRDNTAVRLLAKVNKNGASISDTVIQVSESIAEYTASEVLKPGVRIINRVREGTVESYMRKAMNRSGHCELILPLKLDGVLIGSVHVWEKGEDRFNQSDADLLELLHDPFAIAIANYRKHQEVVRLQERLKDHNKLLTRELRSIRGDEIIGADFGLRSVMEMVRQVAPKNSPVLILGETGVGKEIIANAIHYSSQRRDAPFIKVNCGAIPENLIDSELFGHEKGAFTGAVSRKLGRFERAHEGTIFLDEIGELPLSAQVRLLRVIQQREIERVGGTETIHLETRIICATHRKIENMVENGDFREDLWYRLNVFPILIPPLRQRREDIPELTRYFLRRKAAELNLGIVPEFAPGQMEALMENQWRGNVRELENLIERALIRYSSGLLTLTSEAPIPLETSTTAAPDSPVTPGQTRLDYVETRHIQKIMAQTGGKINGTDGAAELLGLHPNTLRFRMDKLGIPYGRKRK